MQKVIREKAIELLSSGKANRVLAWKEGDFFYDQTPFVFQNAEEIEKSLVYNGFSAANLSKYLVKESAKDGVIAVFLKPCDTYSFSQLLKEHRINREKILAVAIPCRGKFDIERIRKAGAKGIRSIREEGDTLVIDTIYGEKKLDRKKPLPKDAKTARARSTPFTTRSSAKRARLAIAADSIW